jgi:hypothetical protein
MEVESYQPLANSKGARCEAESEGSWRQNPEPGNTNCIRHTRQDEIAIQKRQRIRTKLRNLIKLGIPRPKAWEFANTRNGYWRVADSPIPGRTHNG